MSRFLRGLTGRHNLVFFLLLVIPLDTFLSVLLLRLTPAENLAIRLTGTVLLITIFLITDVLGLLWELAQARHELTFAAASVLMLILLCGVAAYEGWHMVAVPFADLEWWATTISVGGFAFLAAL